MFTGFLYWSCCYQAAVSFSCFLCFPFSGSSFFFWIFPELFPCPLWAEPSSSFTTPTRFVCSTVTRLRNIQPHLTGLWSLANTSMKVFYLSLFSGVLQSHENDSSKYFVFQKCTVLAPRGILGTGIFSPSTFLHACFYIWIVFNWKTLGITWFAARLLSCHFIS